MSKKILTVATLVALLSAPIVLRAQEGSEEVAIKALVQTAYVDGLINLGDLDKTRAGFHPEFVLLGVQDGKLTRLPIADWIAGTEKRKAQGQASPQMTCRILQVDMTGNAAVVKLEVHRGDTHVFTDYLSLYKFPDGWQIVGKIYFRHA
ncbi:MAG: nuclear transport factor 2 family protein [Candidatus Aminicenantes bacterium]